MGAFRRRLETRPSSRAVKIQGARGSCPKETGNAVLWAFSKISGRLWELLARKNAPLEFAELLGSGARQPRRQYGREGFGKHSAPRVDRNSMSLGGALGANNHPLREWVPRQTPTPRVGVNGLPPTLPTQTPTHSHGWNGHAGTLVPVTGSLGRGVRSFR